RGISRLESTRPKTPFFAVIAEDSRHNTSQRFLSRRHRCYPRSVPECHARNIVTFEIMAGGFGLLLVESGKARPIKLLRPLHHPLGESVCPGEQVVRHALRPAH